MTEKKQDIKLIALDMDGTLLNSELEISEANKNAIEKALEQGVGVMLATGRWLEFCYPYAEALNLDTYLVTVNGGEIWTSSKALVERHVHEQALMEKMWQLGNGLHVDMWCVATDRIYEIGTDPEDFYAHEWLKIGFYSEDKKKLDLIQKELSNYDELELTNSLPTNIEVNPLGVNKANGLVRVCKELGITMDEVMAVGDSLNDIKMIEQAGFGVAMGNAQDAIKDVADAVTDSNDADGVAKAIERYIL